VATIRRGTMRSWRAEIEGRDHTDIVVLTVILATFSGALMYLSGKWDDLPVWVIYYATYLGIFFVPLLLANNHRRRQDRLLDRIRSRYVLAISEWTHGHDDLAAGQLTKIRRLEALWRLGASVPYRLALLSVVLATGATIGIACQLTGFYLSNRPIRVAFPDFIAQTLAGPSVSWLPGAMGLIMGLVFAIDAARIKSTRRPEFYSDHLAAALKAGRGIDAAPQHDGPTLPPDGVSARDILGLGPHFTKSDLRRAWVRVARDLHPDHWGTSGPAVQAMKEAALKRVNAARDELLPEAR